MVGFMAVGLLVVLVDDVEGMGQGALVDGKGCGGGASVVSQYLGEVGSRTLAERFGLRNCDLTVISQRSPGPGP